MLLKVHETPFAWAHVTDVCTRIEEQELDEYRAMRCWGEHLISVIPLYREEMENEWTATSL